MTSALASGTGPLPGLAPAGTQTLAAASPPPGQAPTGTQTLAAASPPPGQAPTGTQTRGAGPPPGLAPAGTSALASGTSALVADAGPPAEQSPAGLAVPSAQPYPWPYDGAARADRTAVLLVALQAGVAPLCPDAASAIGVMAALTVAAREWGASVIAIRHTASPALRRPSVLPAYGQSPWELLAGLNPDAVVDAFGMDGFSGSPLAECLAGLDIDHLLICGLGLEGPVHSTLRSANDRGLECLLVIDGCAPLDPNLADAAVRIIEMSGGIFGAVATSTAVLRALDGTESGRPDDD